MVPGWRCPSRSTTHATGPALQLDTRAASGSSSPVIPVRCPGNDPRRRRFVVSGQDRLLPPQTGFPMASSDQKSLCRLLSSDPVNPVVGLGQLLETSRFSTALTGRWGSGTDFLSEMNSEVPAHGTECSLASAATAGAFLALHGERQRYPASGSPGPSLPYSIGWLRQLLDCAATTELQAGILAMRQISTMVTTETTATK